MTHAQAAGRRQRGATLIIALIFLVIMAMLGVTVAGVSNLEERMAGNTRDRDLALQAAEAALRDAEVKLADSGFRAAGFPAFDATKANDAAYWDACFGGPVSPCNTNYALARALPTLGPGAVFAQPKYTIEKKPNVDTTEIYRVTARGVGGSAETVVVLQAEYGFTP